MTSDELSTLGRHICNSSDLWKKNHLLRTPQNARPADDNDSKMQSIWLRVAQAQSCYCRACSRATATLTNQKPTSARSPQRQGTTSNYVSRIRRMATTAAAAPMLTTTTEDLSPSSGMLESEEKLDEDQAWGSLAKLFAQQPTRHRLSTLRYIDGRVPAVVQKNPTGIYDALALISENPKLLEKQLAGKRPRQDRINRIDRLHKSIFGGSKRSWQERWWMTPSSRVDELADAVAAEEMQHVYRNRDPTNPLQLEKFHEAINDLVDKLLLEAYKDEQGNATTPDLLSSAWNQVRMLRSDGYPKYRPEGHDRIAAENERAKWNQVNRNILRDWGLLRQHITGLSEKSVLRPWDVQNYKKKREYFIGKICHNLLVLEYLPGIQNYNALIAGLLQIGEHDLARLVSKSYKDKSKLKPSPMTMAVMLHRYRITKNIVGFYSYLGRLTGQDPRGVGLRRRSVADVEGNISQARTWARRADVTMVDGFVVEIPSIERPVVEAVLDGLIDFEQPQQAATVLVACLREGLDIDLKYLPRIVGLCNAHLDRVAAMIIVKELFPKVSQFSALVTANTPADFSQLAHLLDLGESNAERSLFVPTEESRWIKFDDDSIRKYDWNLRLASLRKAMDIALISARLQEVQNWADSFSTYLTSKPDMNDPTFDYHHRELQAVLQKYDGVQHRIQTFRTLARLDWITQLCAINQSKMQTYEKELLHLLVKIIPSKYRSFSIFDVDSTLEKRLQLIKETRETLPWLEQARDCLYTARQLEQSMKWTLCEMLPEEQREGLMKLDENKRPRFTFREALAEWNVYLSRLDQRSGPGDGDTATKPSAEPSYNTTSAQAIKTSQRRLVATAATDMFTAALLDKRFEPSS